MGCAQLTGLFRLKLEQPGISVSLSVDHYETQIVRADFCFTTQTARADTCFFVVLANSC